MIIDFGVCEWLLILECVSDYCLTPNEQFFNYIMAITSYIRWYGDDGRFVLDQHD
jgi:hypothetical protein